MPNEDAPEHPWVTPLGARPHGLFAVEERRFQIGPEHQRIIREMMTWTPERLQLVLEAYLAKLKDRVPPEVLREWYALFTTGFAEAASQALERGDMALYVGLIKSFAKGFAEAGVSFYYLDTLARTYEEALLPSIVETYRDPDELRLALEARHHLMQIHAVIAAEAYYDVSQVTISHLKEELGEALQRPDNLWWAFMETSTKLGLEAFEPRLFARALLKRVGYPGTVVEFGEGYLHTGPHIIIRDCPGDPASCLSGFLAAAKVEDHYGRAVRVTTIRLLPGDLCEVFLVPLGLPEPGVGP